MISLFRWLIGFVRFRFVGGFYDNFLNACFEDRFAVRNVHTDGECLTGECAAGQYLALSRLAKQHGGRLKIIKKRGAVFPFLKIKNRLGLFFGAVAFVILLSFLSGFVWNIEIVGNDRISDAEVEEFLADNGLSAGVFWDSVEKNRIENLMMASFDDCAWVQINELGTTARVEINETRVKPDVVDKSGAANLKATEDGIIVKATVYDGWAAAKKGDAVTAGDLLISGVYDSEAKKGNQFAHARGEYIAQVVEPFELVVNRKQRYKSYTSSSDYRSIAFFGLTVPLYIGPKNSENADVTEYRDYLQINGNDIPIGLVTTSVERYIDAEKTLSDKELTALCKKEIERKLNEEYAECEIVKRKIEISLTADSAIAKGKITCLKDIGEEVPIKINKKKK